MFIAATLVGATKRNDWTPRRDASLDVIALITVLFPLPAFLWTTSRRGTLEKTTH